MKCPACGRTMLESGILAQCPNILCDYEEEIEEWGSFQPERDLSQDIVASFETAIC